MNLLASLSGQVSHSELIALVVAVVLFVVAAVVSGLTRAWWALFVSAGLAFAVLAYIIG